MTDPRFTAVLLCDTHAELASAAEVCADQRFNLLGVFRHGRSTKALSPEAIDLITTQRPHFLLNFLSPVILGRYILASVRRQAINFHPAPPRWPGVGSASFALYHGDATFGATAHLMDEVVDAGAIVKTARFPIGSDDGCDAVFARALDHCLTLFRHVTDVLVRDGGVTGNGEQWERPAITRKQFERWMTLSPNDSVEEFDRKIRACRHPRFGGPFVEVHGVRFALPAGRVVPQLNVTGARVAA